MNSSDKDGASSPQRAGVATDVVAAQHAIIDRLGACERMFADVYAAYAKTFPGSRDFWSALSREEVVHAGILESMKRFLDAGAHFTNIGAAVKGVEETINELTSEVSMTMEGRVSEVNAFRHAIGFESRLVDGHFFESVKCASPEYQRMAASLVKADELHRTRIRDRMLRRQDDERKTAPGRPEPDS